MKFGLFVVFLFLVYLVVGQTLNNVKSDCTKLFNFLNGDSEEYFNNCCDDNEIECDNEGYIQKYITYYILQ